MKKSKEPSLFRRVISIYYEQALRRKAIRRLSKTDWSFDFLSEVVRNAAKQSGKGIEIEIVSETAAGKRSIFIRSIDCKDSHLNADTDIFNELDNEAAVQAFIRKHQPRR